MDEDRFWQIITVACSDLDDVDGWGDRLQAALGELDADAIIAWDRIFKQLAARAYTADLWAAAYLINGGASDDGFYYFRCWLIAMGRAVYEAAVADPDSLADVVYIDEMAEAEIYAAAWHAWMAVTGNSDEADYPVRVEATELQGELWHADDNSEEWRRLPRLAALYLES